jgi:integrase
MAKHLLTARRVAVLVSRGQRRRFGDGGNLYLQVNGLDRGAWVFLTKRNGKQHPIGLGSTRTISLQDARALADACRQAVHQGRDPRTALPGVADGMTFDAAARALIASMAPSWSNAKHRAQWCMTLLGELPPDEDGNVRKTEHDYCSTIRHKSVAKLDTEDALRVLKPLWQAKPETASRLRGRCEGAWDFAKARGHCSGENPFRWRGHLNVLLPKRARLTHGHHKAMSFDDVPAFVTRLRDMRSMSARTLEFLILTAARSGEALGATWDEIDFEARVWTVPGERMKAGKEHRVPLSPRVVEILQELHQSRLSNFVFPGTKRGQSLGTAAMEAALRRAGVDATVHGFRSSFRDWAGDRTSFARDVVEAALAHAIENATEAAYRRSDALEKRRKLMDAWAKYCASAPADQGKVVPLMKKGAAQNQ